MLGLLLFGRFVEAAYGRVRFLVVYVVGAVAGGLAYLAFEPGFGVAIGASGAVLALFGASAAHLAGDARVRATKPGRRELVFLALIALSQLVIDAMWPQSAGSAHAGGLAAGLLFGLLLDRLRRKA
jgi:rhomboid protease GluP